MHRMGLVDFWYYDNEEFYFKEGHMLLRGSNGSGKSVTMQSFIPLLLDGNKSSERLDSFGTRSRKIENYLLEEDGDREERIGYLYLEFKREDSEIYKTIGMGLHARRNKPMNTWYFVIEDNRRINIDFSLLDHQLAITKQVLKNIIGSQLIESQKEYMDRVNQTLFGFASRDDYKEAINLLMQLRSPKLSNSLKPTMINEILSDSLQPLSEDDLRPMSEAISNMDEIKDQLDALKLSYNAAKDIAQVYNTYNYVVLDTKAQAYLEEEKVWASIQENILKINQEIASCIEEQEINNEKLKERKLEQNVLIEEKSSLVQQDMVQLVDDIARHKEDVQDAIQKRQEKQSQYEEKDNRRIDVKNNVESTVNKQQELYQSTIIILDNMDVLQEQMQFIEHTALREELLLNLEIEYDASFAQKQIKAAIEELQQGLVLLQKLHGLKNQEESIIEQRSQYEVQREQAQKKLKQYQTLFQELQEEQKEAYSRWNQCNKWLHVSDKQMLEIIHQIQSYQEDDNAFQAIDQMIHDNYFKQYQLFTKTKLQMEQEQKQIQGKLLEVQKEIDHWESQKDPQPELDAYVKENRSFLKEQAIPFQPLYQMLDFDSSISMEKRNAFEEMLARSGLLNALVVPELYKAQLLDLKEGMADQYLFTKDHQLDKEVFVLHEGILDGNLKELFTYFQIDQTQFQMHPSYYEIGSLTGTISRKMESKFIGKASRERYRKEMLDLLYSKRNDLKAQLQEIEAKHQEMLVQISELEKEYAAVPKPNDLQLTKEQIYKEERNLEDIQQRIANVQSELDKLQAIITINKKEIQAVADHMQITSTREVFEATKDAYMEYEGNLRDVLMLQKQYAYSYEFKASLDIQLQDLEQDVDTLRAEYKALELQIEKLQAFIKQKEEQLASMGYEDIKKRMDEIQERLLHLPLEISTSERRDAELNTQIKQKKDLQKENVQMLELQKAKKEQSYLRYQEEAALYYVFDQSDDIKQVELIHKRIQKAYPEHKRKDVLGNDLQTSFYAHRGALQEYNLSIYTVFEDEESSRLDISARYQGLKIPFLQLLENLQNDIDKQSILLEDSDRALIEDILVNTISKKIRVHIQNSKRWVENMNHYMNAMNTSSGLKLNLQWKSRKAETEEEMNSEKLVELLEKDVRILKDTDVKRLSNHFRSKITVARKIAEQQDTHESFHQVMRKVMDYRNWFDFRILSQKTGEKKKELTNNAFYAFSGGEKAMAMYVPLFSAVAAKFESANEDAPLLIALDEAFAGVDEKNINNMFDLIGKFKFDYIMNSQVLWGDYPSVRSLAIYELFRPENAHFVTVIAYEWNGKIKRLVNV